MKLVVCGDSYMSALTHFEFGYRGHFTELLAHRLGWEYETYARGACSNSAIRLQIDAAIDAKPSLVIIGTTTPDRFEYPDNRNETSLISNFGVYDKGLGIRNINYSKSERASENQLFRNHVPTLISATLTNMLIADRETLTLEQLDAWNKYFQFCYDSRWKQQQDTWIISSGLQKLIDYKIPFYLISNFLYEQDLEFCIDSIIDQSDVSLNPWRNVCKTAKARFHTDLEGQRRLAENWYNRLARDGWTE